MEKRKRRLSWGLALLLLSLGLTGILVFGLRALLEAPLRALLLIHWFIAGLPEIVVWAVVATLGGWLALRTRWTLAVRRLQGGGQAPAFSRKSEGIAATAHLIQRAGTSRVSRIRIGRHLAEVAVNLLVRRRRISSQEAWQLMHQGKWPADQRVYGVLFPQQTLGPIDEYLQDFERAVGFLEHYDRGDINDDSEGS